MRRDQYKRLRYTLSEDKLCPALALSTVYLQVHPPPIFLQWWWESRNGKQVNDLQALQVFRSVVSTCFADGGKGSPGSKASYKSGTAKL